jgi:hypothetical protein
MNQYDSPDGENWAIHAIEPDCSRGTAIHDSDVTTVEYARQVVRSPW